MCVLVCFGQPHSTVSRFAKLLKQSQTSQWQLKRNPQRFCYFFMETDPFKTSYISWPKDQHWELTASQCPRLPSAGEMEHLVLFRISCFLVVSCYEWERQQWFTWKWSSGRWSHLICVPPALPFHVHVVLAGDFSDKYVKPRWAHETYSFQRLISNYDVLVYDVWKRKVSLTHPKNKGWSSLAGEHVNARKCLLCNPSSLVLLIAVCSIQAAPFLSSS